MRTVNVDNSHTILCLSSSTACCSSNILYGMLYYSLVIDLRCFVGNHTDTYLIKKLNKKCGYIMKINLMKTIVAKPIYVSLVQSNFRYNQYDNTVCIETIGDISGMFHLPSRKPGYEATPNCTVPSLDGRWNISRPPPVHLYYQVLLVGLTHAHAVVPRLSFPSPKRAWVYIG